MFKSLYPIKIKGYMLKKEQAYILIWYKKIKAIKFLGGKCSLCGEDRPWVLSFHHNNPEEKEFNFNLIKGHRWPVIKEEIKKCVLMCGNCHKEIHHIKKNTKSQINKKICLEYKKTDGCELCNYNKCNDSLSFHHIDDKNLDLANTLNNSKIFKNVQDISKKLKFELDKCSVFCMNCHSDIHFDRKKFNKYKPFIYNHNYKETPKPVNKDDVLEIYRKGMKQDTIARELNCAKSTISTIIKKIGRNVSNLNLQSFKQERLEKIFKKIKIDKKNCWTWIGCRRKNYGIVSFKNKNKIKEIPIHRLIYELLKGPVQKKLYVAHTCENTFCCNPDHLFLATPKELGQYKKKKGRTHRTIGEKSGRCKLSKEKIIAIRKDKRKQIDIAIDYGVAKSTICMIKNRTSRKYE